MFSYDADINSPANKDQNISLKNVQTDSIHHRPTPSPEPDPKKVKPNDTSNSDKIIINGIELSEDIIERLATKLEEIGYDFDMKEKTTTTKQTQ